MYVQSLCVHSVSPVSLSPGTVTYMYHRESPLMIRHDNPPTDGGQSPARFVFSLRDPVERAWSDFRFNYK